MNVYGGLEDKLENYDFTEQFKNFDIVFFSESWTNDKSILKLEDFAEPICKHRSRRKNARRDSGGLVCFIKKNIFKGVKNINWEYEDGIVIELNKIFFGFNDNLYIIAPYIKPSTSSRNVITCDSDAFDVVTDKLADLSPKGDVLIVCDLNARTGSLEEYTNITDNDETDFVTDRSITPHDLLSLGLSIDRTSQDTTVNEYGLKLVNLCKMSDLIILNGRTGDDKDIGNLTYCSKRGKSVNDYAICSKDVISMVKNFFIHNFTAFSDHALIGLELHCTIGNIDNDLNGCDSHETFDVKMKWKNDKRDNYTNSLNESSNIFLLENISRSLDDDNLNESIIDDCVNKLNDLFLTAGESHKIKHNINSNKNSNNQGIWYDSECKEKRLLFESAERLFRNSGSDTDRVVMCEERKIYRNICRQKRKQHQLNQANELAYLSSHNPKLFWNKIRNKKTRKSGNCDFLNYFKNLNASKPFMGPEEEDLINDWEDNGDVVCDPDLDELISMNELESAIKNLKCNKAHGMDKVLNEFIINGNSMLKNIILKLFNAIFTSGCFPKAWAIGEIIPIYKKGDKNDPQNYRGITLLSCIGKLFTSIINTRLNKWAEINDIFSEQQYGFREARSTTDCLFIIHGLIEHFLNMSKTLYCGFIDLKRAFDGVNRRALFYKLNLNKISTKIIAIVREMYSKIKLCVRSAGGQAGRPTDHDFSYYTSCEDHDFSYFTSYAGVFQGESLSPFLFSMFLNDMENILSNDDETGVELEHGLKLYLVMFADDMTIFSETRKGLQNGLDALHVYCNRWGLTVNVDKTKCVAFKKGGRSGKLDKWKYNGQDIETVTQFKYLGLVLGSSGKFTKSIQALSEDSRKALFNLKVIFQQFSELTVDIQLKLFKSLILPKLTYSCEIWGFCEAEPLEKIHRSFLKSILGVRKTVPNVYVYKELNQEPIINIRLFRIVKYWLKILRLKDSNPVKIIYKTLKRDIEINQNITNWVSLLKNNLEKFGFGYAWVQQDIPNELKFLSEFKQRISDIYLQQCHETISNLSEHRIYRLLCDNQNGLNYLRDIKEKYIRVSITRIRLGSNNLMIERGRWQRPKVEFIDRICDDCQVIEDEFHVLLKCKRFSELRQQYLPYRLYDKPNMYSFIDFINNASANEIRLLGIFCYKMFDIYNKNYV